MQVTARESVRGLGSFFGMMWSGDPGRTANLLDVVQNSGAKMLRLEIKPGAQFQTDIDNTFERADARGITILPYFGSGAFPKANTTNRKHWVEYAEKMVKKYGPDGNLNHPAKAWEIWNEPNKRQAVNKPAQEEGDVNPKDFAGFLKAMSGSLRSSSKEPIEVLAPGMFSFRSSENNHMTMLPKVFMERMDNELSSLGDPNAYDAFSLHPYVFGVHKRPPTENNRKQIVKAIQGSIYRLHKVDPEKDIWITELGFPVRNDVPVINPAPEGKVPRVKLSLQKQLIQASFAMMRNHRGPLNIAHAFYYNIEDLPGSHNWEYRCGLRDANGNERPAWNAYRALAHGE